MKLTRGSLKMNEITIPQLIKLVQPGDVLETSGTGTLGKMIRLAQQLEGDHAKYTHIALFGQQETINKWLIYEAYKTLDLHELKQYVGTDICVMRNVDMSPMRLKNRFFEIQNNLGSIYPYHRLFFHLTDSCFNWAFRKLDLNCRMKIAKWIAFDYPVCSEWVAQIFEEDFKHWAGVTPDDFDDKRLRSPYRWKTIFEGRLINEVKIPIQESNVLCNNQYKEFQTCF